MDQKELAKNELIGLHVRVQESTNKDQKGLEGVVVDETKNLLVISTENGEKKVFKGQSVFIFTLNDSSKVRIEGGTLIGRSEERIKKKWPKKRW